MPATDLEQVVNLCKRRGFVYPSAEIYGGFRSTYDYGPQRSSWMATLVTFVPARSVRQPTASPT